MMASPTDEPTELSPEASTEAPVKPPIAKAPSLLKAAGLIALVTIFSKFLGFIRDWAIMYVYGTSLTSDAYFAAFQLPAFSIVLLGGLGGPFHTATVAVFSRLIKDNEAPGEKAKKLASTFITLTSLAFTVLSLLAFLFARPIMGLILSQENPALIEAAAAQLRIMSPCILAGGIVGILYGLSNVYNCFFWPSMSPAAMSITVLIGLFCFPHDPTGMILAWSTLAGGGLQVVMQLPEFFRQKFGLFASPGTVRETVRIPELKQAGELLLPATIGTTIGQLVTYVDMFFASQLGAGGWAAVTLSNRLVQLPIGVLQTALLVPIFPRFSRAAGEGRFDDIKRDFKTGVISLWLISIPMLVLMLLYTEPLIRLIFQHGRFDAESTRLVSVALIFQAFQIIPYFARDSITRVFYAFQDSKTPLMIGLAAIVIKAGLNWFLVPRFGVGGITFTITLITFINMTLLGILSKKHIKDLGFAEMIAPFFKLMAAAAVMAGICLAIQNSLDRNLFVQLLGRLVSPNIAQPASEYLLLAIAALSGCVAYGGTTILLKVSEAEYLKERLGGLLKRKASRG